MNAETKSFREEEMYTALNLVREENAHLPTFTYFTDLVYEWYEGRMRFLSDPQVIVMGTGIPDELLRAAGILPSYILGGSHESCAWSDDSMPRDADPVSRSMQGLLQRPGMGDKKSALFLVPLNSDSMRKMASRLVREGHHVVTVDMPPLREEPEAVRKWEDQLVHMLDEVTAYAKTRVTAGSLEREIGRAFHARRYMRSLWRKIYECGDSLTFSGRILLQNSYYYTENLEEWTRMLRVLLKEMQEKRRGILSRKGDPKSNILLMGSPVYFPNNKLPELFAGTGLRVIQNIDASTGVFDIIPKVSGAGRSPRRMVERIAKAYLRSDLSSSGIRNEALRRKVQDVVRTEAIEGVVFHILKGQLEGDFELVYFESFFESLNIPVFRLETDYQYQDVEQLRIRLEAFSEMLSRRRIAEELGGRRAV